MTELDYLVWSAALLLAQVVLQAVTTNLNIGFRWAIGAQDDRREPTSVVAQRIKRSLHNLLETYPAFVALAAYIGITGTGTATTAFGAALWFWMRVLYVPVYASGVPVVRPVVWWTSMVGLILMALPLVT